jgi:hypothetical protein
MSCKHDSVSINIDRPDDYYIISQNVVGNQVNNISCVCDDCGKLMAKVSPCSLYVVDHEASNRRCTARNGKVTLRG